MLLWILFLAITSVVFFAWLCFFSLTLSLWIEGIEGESGLRIVRWYVSAIFFVLTFVTCFLLYHHHESLIP